MSNYYAMFKVLIIGNSQVGKTNLMMCYCEGAYSDTHIATIGVDFKFKELMVDNQKIKLQIWDTAGQERFKTLTQSYYKGAHGIILVYAVDDLDSYNDLENWIDNVKDHGKEGVPIIIVGNKVDLKDKRVVSTQQAQDLASKYNFSYYETSAKENINVNEIFNSITQLMISNIENRQSQLNQSNTVNESQHLTYQLANSQSKKKEKKKKDCC